MTRLVTIVMLLWASAAGAADDFRRAPDFAPWGFLMPLEPLQIGGIRLDHVMLGGPDFADWEAGRRKIANYAPLMVELVDLESPTAVNEMGQTYHTGGFRVLPQAYTVVPGYLEFQGFAPEIGPVHLAGPMDPGALDQAMDMGAALADRPVWTATVILGGVTVTGVPFTWTGGD